MYIVIQNETKSMFETHSNCKKTMNSKNIEILQFHLEHVKIMEGFFKK